MRHKNKALIVRIASSPLTFGIVWFLSDFALNWRERPLGANIARSFFDAIVTTAIFTLLEKIVPMDFGKPDKS